MKDPFNAHSDERNCRQQVITFLPSRNKSYLFSLFKTFLIIIGLFDKIFIQLFQLSYNFHSSEHRFQFYINLIFPHEHQIQIVITNICKTSMTLKFDQASFHFSMTHFKSYITCFDFHQ